MHYNQWRTVFIATMYNFRNIDQLTLHCSFDSILFVTVLDVDRVADKHSRKSIVHMSTSWPSSKFSLTNAARAIQISVLRPLLRNKINNYRKFYDVNCIFLR